MKNTRCNFSQYFFCNATVNLRLFRTFHIVLWKTEIPGPNGRETYTWAKYGTEKTRKNLVRHKRRCSGETCTPVDIAASQQLSSMT